MPTARSRPSSRGPFEHRQRQRVGDPEDGHDGREPEEHVHDGEELVDGGLLGVAELVLGPHLDLGILVGDRGDGGPRLLLAHAVGVHRADELVEVGGEERVPVVVVDEPVGIGDSPVVEDGGHRERGGLTAGELHLDRVADGEGSILGPTAVDDDVARAGAARRARDDVEVEVVADQPQVGAERVVDLLVGRAERIRLEPVGHDRVELGEPLEPVAELLAERRVLVGAVADAHEPVGADRLIEHVAERGLERGPEHRHGADQGQPDHEGAAVEEVRRGLRAAFSRDSWPVIPNAWGNGAPIVRGDGLGEERADQVHADEHDEGAAGQRDQQLDRAEVGHCGDGRAGRRRRP